MIKSYSRWRTELIRCQGSGEGLVGGEYRADEPHVGRPWCQQDQEQPSPVCLAHRDHGRRVVRQL